MAITLIRKNTDEGPQNLSFKTIVDIVEDPDGDSTIKKLFAEIRIVDDKLKPLSAPVQQEVAATEEQYHILLRLGASEAGQLITSHSTNPEWNPKGYSKNLEDEL